jgi:hypothetical protein
MPFQVASEDSATASALRTALLAQDVESRPTIRLLMSGGNREEALRFELVIEPDGTARSVIRDGLHDQDGSAQVILSDTQLRRLSERLLDTSLLRLRAPQPLWIPDSVIGSLEITSSGGRESGEGSSERWYFYADKDQALVAEDAPPPELVEAVSSLLEIVERAPELPGPTDTNLVGV